MKNHHRFERVCRASAAAVLAVVGLVVLAADGVAQVQLEMAQQFVRPMIAPLVAQGDGTGDAIGDPWWDDAEAARPDAKPQPVAADDAPAADPADAQAMLHAQVEMFAQNVRQQGLAILRRELSLVRQSCPSLEKQQRALVLEAGRGVIDRAVDELMQAAGGGRRRVARKRDGDLEAAIRDALKAAVKANAAEAESAAYEGEHGLREERRKAAVVAAIVAEVDREAYLDDAEREALAKGLTASYRERWRPVVTTLQQSGMVVPDESNLPGLERCVEKALGKERKAQWLAARDEARRLAGGPGMQRGWVQMPGNVGVRAQRLGNGGVRAQFFLGRGIRRPAGDELTVEAQEDGAAVEAGPVEEQK